MTALLDVTAAWPWVSVRLIVALVVIASITGAVPRLLAAVMGATLGLLVAAALPAVQLPTSGTGALLLAVREAAVGATLGLLAALPLVVAGWAGAWIETSLGGAPGERTGRHLVGLMTTAVFVGLGGPALLAAALATSYRAAPLGGGATAVDALGLAWALGGLATSALQLALPLLLCAAIVEVAIGAAARVGGTTGGAMAALPWRRAAMMIALAAGLLMLAIGVATGLRSAWP